MRGKCPDKIIIDFGTRRYTRVEKKTAVFKNIRTL